MTTKTGNFIFITKRDDSEAENVIKYIDLIVNLVTSHHGNIVTILELPEYSITTHNRHKNHPNPDSFKNDDKLLHAQIFRLNGYILFTVTCYMYVTLTKIYRLRKKNYAFILH